MLAIDTSDCWLNIGVGKKFMRSLTWHFSRFLRRTAAQRCGMAALDVQGIDHEARLLAERFVVDMQDYFRHALADAYVDLEDISPDCILELYIQENLADFEAAYLRGQLDAPTPAPAPVCSIPDTVVAIAVRH